MRFQKVWGEPNSVRSTLVWMKERLSVALKKDTTKNKEEALKEIYKKLRPGEPPDKANAEALIKRLFLDPKGMI